MRTFVAAAAAIALLTVPAFSQGMSQGGGKQRPGHQFKEEGKKNKVDDKDYKSALERIPEAKQKYDPWQNVREAPSQPK
jgi:hypothetical protein